MPAVQPGEPGSKYPYVGYPGNSRNISEVQVIPQWMIVNTLNTDVLPIRVKLVYPDRSQFSSQEDKGIGLTNYWNYIEVEIVEMNHTYDPLAGVGNNLSGDPTVVDINTVEFGWECANGQKIDYWQNCFVPLTTVSPVDSALEVELPFNVAKEHWFKVGKYYTDSPNVRESYESSYDWVTKVAVRSRAITVKEWTNADSYVPSTVSNAVVAVGPWNYLEPTIIYSKTGPSAKAYSNTPTETAAEEDLPAKNIRMDLLRTNLPISSKSAASITNPSGLGKVKWRHGLIHTWEDTPADGAFPDQTPYGLRFHYNPASWAQSVSFTENINADALAASQMDRLPLPGGFASISFTLFLNRIADLAGVRDVYKLAPIAGLYNTIVPKTPLDEADISALALKMYSMYDEARQGIGVPNAAVGFIANRDKTEHIERIIRQGTLYDLDFLYASANGRSLGSFHVNGPGMTNPSYIGDAWKPSDYGYIAPRFIRVWLGPHITFVGRINNIDVQHLMFTQYMVPTFTQVNISITRGLTFGKDTKDAQTLFNTNSAALGIANTATENNSSATGTVGQ